MDFLTELKTTGLTFGYAFLGAIIGYSLVLALSKIFKFKTRQTNHFFTLVMIALILTVFLTLKRILIHNYGFTKPEVDKLFMMISLTLFGLIALAYYFLNKKK